MIVMKSLIVAGALLALATPGAAEAGLLKKLLREGANQLREAGRQKAEAALEQAAGAIEQAAKGSPGGGDRGARQPAAPKPGELSDSAAQPSAPTQIAESEVPICCRR